MSSRHNRGLHIPNRLNKGFSCDSGAVKVKPVSMFVKKRPGRRLSMGMNEGIFLLHAKN